MLNQSRIMQNNQIIPLNNSNKINSSSNFYSSMPPMRPYTTSNTPSFYPILDYTPTAPDISDL